MCFDRSTTSTAIDPLWTPQHYFEKCFSRPVLKFGEGVCKGTELLLFFSKYSRATLLTYWPLWYSIAYREIETHFIFYFTLSPYYYFSNQSTVLTAFDLFVEISPEQFLHSYHIIGLIWLQTVHNNVIKVKKSNLIIKNLNVLKFT